MSKSKRTKSGSAHDHTRWETGLVQAILNDETWKTCIFFLAPNKLEDNALIDISCEVVSTGLRRLFSVITKETLYKEVKEFAKASVAGGGKGKQTVKLPDFVEVCELVKPFIDQDDDIPAAHLAKLLKFKLLHLKTLDSERRDEAKKAKGSGVKRTESKRATSPSKAKSPKRKGKKGEPESSPLPKKDTKMKKRGEVEETFKTIDDEPDDPDSPQHYILIHGFCTSSVLLHLANIGVHINAIINLKQNEYKTITLSSNEGSKPDEVVDVGEGEDEDGHGVSQENKTDEIINYEKNEVKLAKFWKESDELIINAPSGHKLKDIGKYEVVMSNSLDEDSLTSADKKTELGTDIFEKIANVCYDMLDHKKNHQQYLDAMKLLHIPLHTPCDGPIEPQAAAPQLATELTKDLITPVDIDLRYYNHLVSSIPDESMTVPIILHSLLEQVVSLVDQTNPMEKQLPPREDGLDHDLAAHINSKTADLALSPEEKEILLEKDNEKKRRENMTVPQVLDYNDHRAQRLCYLEDLTIMDGLETELAMLAITPPTVCRKFPSRTEAELMETKTRFHQLIQHCVLGQPKEVARALKNYTFEGMALKSVDNNGDILEPCEVDRIFCSYNNPWDDPYSDLTKYFTNINSTNADCDPHTAAVNLVSFRNLDQWCYIEHFDKNTLAQVFNEARHTLPYVDTYYHKQDDTLLVVFHNPVGPQLHSRSTWNVRLHSNVGFRNYLEHVKERVSDWTREQELIEEETNKVLTPVVPTPEPPQVQVKTGSRYGLKTRAEIAALKAEEDDKGKKKGGRRSARARSRSGKKSPASKPGSTERKGSSQKNRATSGSHSRGNKASRTKVGQEIEPEPEIKPDDIEEEKHYDFLGYDVGDDLIHVTGVQTSMFPCDGGQIRVEKTTFVHKPSTVNTSVYKDGNILKLHFLEPTEEIVEEVVKTSSNMDMKENIEKKENLAENQLSDDGMEKSEFEENEKQSESQIETKPVFCKHGSFVAILNDGMTISTSGFGNQGLPPKAQHHICPVENSASDQQQQPAGADVSPPPKVTSPKSRKKNDEETKRQEEERKKGVEEEEESRRVKVEEKVPKNPFHEVFITCPDGLHVSYQNDGSFPSMVGGVIVRQRYPVTSRGLHDCEAVRRKIATEEKSRCIRTDGSVIKIMMDNSVQVLYPHGMTSTCSIFPSKLLQCGGPPEISNQPVNRKIPITTTSKDDDPVDQDETVPVLQAEWTTITCDGEKFVQNLDGSKTSLDPVRLSVATCPVTDQIYKTREDNVITVIRPNGTQIVEHSDGTRITTFYEHVQTEVVAADQETGEEAKYESQLCRFVKVECEGFATVVVDAVHGWAETLFGNGSKMKTLPNGNCVLRKTDGSQLHFDIKGNIVYVPCELPRNNHDDVNLASVVDSSQDCSGVYILRTTSQHCCEMSDERGNVFTAFTNGEIKIDQALETSSSDLTTITGQQCGGVDQKDREKRFKALSSVPLTPHVPRFFVLNRDGSGYELLREQDVSNYLTAAENDPSTAVLRSPVEGQPGLNGITVLKPFTGGIGKTWLLGKDETNLIPEGLRERDFKSFPRKEFKKTGLMFGRTAGQGLNIGNMKKSQTITPQLTCPKVLVLRHLTQHEPLDITRRQTMSAAFQKYGDYVMQCQMKLDNLLSHEPRDHEEVKRAKELTRKYEPVKYTITNKNEKVFSDEYIKSVTTSEEPAASPPVWKRPPGEWERDRIELAKLEYGKHALRFQEVPPYFETSQGQKFLARSKNMPDMKKLTADLDRQACPDRRPVSELSGSSTPIDNEVTVNQANRSNSKSVDSSAVLENLVENDGRTSLTDQPLQSSTPFASRPVNPTPAQAAGRPTPTTVRPNNPTPAKASNVIGYESSGDSPRVNNVQQDVAPGSTPLEALMETSNEVSFEEDGGYRMDNDTALDLNSSVDSQLNEDRKIKSLYIDVTGSPRKDPVKLPKAILGAKPGALPNTQFSTIEDGVRRKVQTVSVASSKNISTMRGFQLHPSEVDFGVLKEGCTYIHSVMMKNIGIDIARFKIRQPPPSTGIKVLFTPGPVAAGMSSQVDIEIFAVAVGVSGETGVGSIGHHVEIVSQTDIIYLPVTAIILTSFEYDNRSPTAPRGGPSQGTRMIANRPPSREAIRPHRDHLYSNVGQKF